MKIITIIKYQATWVLWGLRVFGFFSLSFPLNWVLSTCCVLRPLKADVEFAGSSVGVMSEPAGWVPSKDTSASINQRFWVTNQQFIYILFSSSQCNELFLEKCLLTCNVKCNMWNKYVRSTSNCKKVYLASYFNHTYCCCAQSKQNEVNSMLSKFWDYDLMVRSSTTKVQQCSLIWLVISSITKYIKMVLLCNY